MDKHVIQGLILRIIIYVTVCLFLDYVLRRSTILQYTFGKDVSFLFNPLIAASTALCFASIVKLLLSGEVAFALIRSLKELAAALFFAIVLMNNPIPQALNPLGLRLLAGTLTIIFYQLADVLLQFYGGVVLKALAGSLCIFATGYIISNSFSLIINEVLDAVSIKSICLPEKIYYTFSALSVLSLIGILENSRNPYLSYIGKKFGGTSGKVSFFIGVLVLQFYFSDFRPIIAKQHPNYVIVIEWMLVCLVSFAIYRMVRGYVLRHFAEELRSGEWKTHVQRIFHKADKVAEVSNVVEKFVGSGIKAGVLSYTITALAKNGASEEEIESLTRKLADYEDDPVPKLTLAWELKKLEEKNRRQRLKILTLTLCDVSKFIGLSSKTISLEKPAMEEVT